MGAERNQFGQTSRRLAQPGAERLPNNLKDDLVRIGLATDHGGSELKERLLIRLREAGHEVIDFGAFELNPDDDYPDFVIPLSDAVAAGKLERGLAI